MALTATVMSKNAQLALYEIRANVEEEEEELIMLGRKRICPLSPQKPNQQWTDKYCRVGFARTGLKYVVHLAEISRLLLEGFL